MPQLLVINDEKPLKEKHISWFSTPSTMDNGKIILNEVVERRYRHPQAPNDAFVDQIEIVQRVIIDETRYEAAGLHLLQHAENNIRILVKEGILEKFDK